MTHSPILRPQAEAEYEAAALWYESQQAGRGAAFQAAVEAVLTAIATQPDRYPIHTRDIREAPVLGYPYCIYYRLSSGRLFVIAIFHASRDPSVWQSRA